MVAEWERHLELVIALLLLLLVEVAVHDAAVGLHHGPAGAGAGPRLAEPDVEGGGGEAGGLLHGGLGPHHALLRSAWCLVSRAGSCLSPSPQTCWLHHGGQVL